MRRRWLLLLLSITLPACEPSSTGERVDSIEGKCEFPARTLPTPTGDYCVGTTQISNPVDESRIDELSSKTPQGQRELLIRIWYPVEPGVTGSTAAYMDAAVKDDLVNEFIGFTVPELEDLHEQVQTHSLLDAPLALQTRKFPVVLFSPGYGAVYQVHHTLLEDLASHGYVVFAINHPHLAALTSYPDGRPIETREPPESETTQMMLYSYLERILRVPVQDHGFVIDLAAELDQEAGGRFENRLDLSRLGAFGHSYGGATSFASCSEDARIRAAIDIDGSLFGDVVRKGTDTPLLAIIGDNKMRFDNSLRKMGADTHRVALDEAIHSSFLDLAVLLPELAPSLADLMESAYGMKFVEPRLKLQITRAYVLAFFQVYLQEQPLEQLLDLAGAYGAEVEFETLKPAASGHVPEDPGLSWVPVPGARFEMGCSPADGDCAADELPVHAVEVPAFEMTAQPITEAQYLAVTGEVPSIIPCDADCPVEGAIQADAAAFCAAVGGRLPSEAEWEYAARAGSTTIYSCGDDPVCLDDVAWHSGNSDKAVHAVGEKQPNALGLYDMFGNLWEWVADCYHDSYDGAPDDGAAWREQDCATGAVVRGGDRHRKAETLRSANRNWIYPEGSPTYVEFRCVRD